MGIYRSDPDGADRVLLAEASQWLADRGDPDRGPFAVDTGSGAGHSLGLEQAGPVAGKRFGEGAADAGVCPYPAAAGFYCPKLGYDDVPEKGRRGDLF